MGIDKNKMGMDKRTAIVWMLAQGVCPAVRPVAEEGLERAGAARCCCRGSTMHLWGHTNAGNLPMKEILHGQTNK